MTLLSWGGGKNWEIKFDLQRFAEVSNPYIDNLNEDIDISGNLDKQRTLVDLSQYASYNIPNYQTITEIPKENIEYLSSGLSASRCFNTFVNCFELTSIPWNDFDIDTSKCTDMNGMFYWCQSLTSLDLSSMDTSNVTNMNSMFVYCQALSSLKISNFNTSKVTDMKYMFSICTSLITLDLTGWNTSKVTNMQSMFSNCYDLQEIICPNGFDMSSCTSVYNMFQYNTSNYSGEPLHFKNVPRSLDFSNIQGAEGQYYVIDSYLD